MCYSIRTVSLHFFPLNLVKTLMIRAQPLSIEIFSKNTQILQIVFVLEMKQRLNYNEKTRKEKAEKELIESFNFHTSINGEKKK